MIKNKYTRKFQMAIVAIVTILTMCSTSWAATYYVDATSGNNNNNGLLQNKAWKTIAKVNKAKFNPGDKILFARGNMWREKLKVSSSGSSSNPITFGAYGSGPKPVINGSFVVNSWVSEIVSGKTIYSATQDIDGNTLSRTNQVFFNDNRINASTKPFADLGINEWKWESPKLYINVGGDPASGLVESSSSVRWSCIVVSDKDYITFKDISVVKANQDGFLATNGSSNIHIDNLTASQNYWAGINIWDETETQVIGSVKNSQIESNGGNGVHFSDVQQWVISHNEVHSNCHLKEHINQQYIAGIKFNGRKSSNNKIEHNHVSGSITGCGIWLDFCGSNNIIRYNDIHDNYSHGIFNEITSNTKIFYNKSYNNGPGNTASGIYVFGRTGDFPDHGPANGNLIYNNVCYGNAFIGIMIQGDRKSTGIINNNILKNNISVGHRIQFRAGGDAEKSNTGNVFEHNCFGIEKQNFIEWGWGIYKSTYDEWETAYGSNTHSVEADPLFNDAASGDFTSKEGSPCINSGAAVGLTHDFAGKIIKDTPDIGPYEWSAQDISSPRSPSGIKIASEKL